MERSGRQRVGVAKWTMATNSDGHVRLCNSNYGEGYTYGHLLHGRGCSNGLTGSKLEIEDYY